ncbi:MAG: hypothetical protein ACYDER_04125 [Ktedonobacteraceae bacterium]
MPIVTSTNTAAKLKRASMAPAPSWGDGTAPLGWQENSGPVVGTPQFGTPAPGSLSSISQQTPYPQPGQMWLPTSTPPSTPAPVSSVSGSNFKASEIREGYQPLLQAQDIHGGTRPLRPMSPIDKMRRTPMATSNLGFIIAGLCVLTGALLLILVYVLSVGLAPSTMQTQSITVGNSVKTTTRQHTPTAVPTRNEQPSPTVTSGAFPAQQYIINPQMASAVNTNTAQVIQAATTFHVGQRVYVTFTIHPNGQSGAVCLQWYANAHAFSHFEFAVSSSSTVAYSYTYYANAAPAYVEIYWASSASCSDELLAQRVNFTVVN